MADLQLILYRSNNVQQLQYVHIWHLLGLVAEADNLSTQPVSPFLSLPAEIRNIIYDLALQGSTLEVFPDLQSQNRPQALSLIHTCRQIRLEALKIFYMSNTFDFAYMVTHIPRFIRTVSSEACKVVRSIRINHHDACLVLFHARLGRPRLWFQCFPALEEVVIVDAMALWGLRLAVAAAIRLTTGKGDMVVRFEGGH
jgi:hypothetical protein